MPPSPCVAVTPTVAWKTIGKPAVPPNVNFYVAHPGGNASLGHYQDTTCTEYPRLRGAATRKKCADCPHMKSFFLSRKLL